MARQSKISEIMRAIARDPQMKREVAQVLFATADAVKTEARISITTGAVSGANHVPSAPGEAPNNDTGVLASNIEAFRTSDPLTVEVRSQAPYAVALEAGTSRMVARPYMAPAVRKIAPTMFPKVQKVLQRAIKRAANK